ncbi:MAG: AbrB/MazE/SpoVT family DNA-binding domain-containing protein [Hyphomonadaceae bacterium]|nr:AbrB/MazE/SpoVT family DNA-binding domain-containing protein [Clostridia bacterium]
MYTTIQKWGNSGALRIPKSILETASIKENDKVEILADHDGITIRKASRKYRNLDELFKGYEGTYTCEEFDTGSPVGKEVLV